MHGLISFNFAGVLPSFQPLQPRGALASLPVGVFVELGIVSLGSVAERSPGTPGGVLLLPFDDQFARPKTFAGWNIVAGDWHWAANRLGDHRGEGRWRQSFSPLAMFCAFVAMA